MSSIVARGLVKRYNLEEDFSVLENLVVYARYFGIH